MTVYQENRYIRHIMLREIGESGQDSLRKKKILVVGAGGLGSPLLLYLASAGVGAITIIDHDNVSLSNLPRQILFCDADIGHNKAQIAATFLSGRYGDPVIQAVQSPLDTKIADKYVAGADLVIDTSDSFLTKYILSDMCHKYKKPLLIGAVTGTSGYCGFFNNKVTYRDIFPEPSLEAGNCNDQGVLSSMCGHIATCMVNIALEYCANGISSLDNKIVNFTHVPYTSNIIDFSDHQPQKQEPFPDIQFIMDYESLTDYQVIDIRSPQELMVKPPLDGAVHIPMQEFFHNPILISQFKKPAFMCAIGRRATLLALWLSVHHSKDASSLGIFINP